LAKAATQNPDLFTFAMKIENLQEVEPTKEEKEKRGGQNLPPKKQPVPPSLS